MSTGASMGADFADVLLVGGTVLTLDPARPRASAVALKGDRILAVGDSKALSPWVGPLTRRIDVGGAAILPAFHDCHVHLWKEGMLLQQVNARPAVAPTLEALVDAFALAARALPPGTWIEGRGYNELELAGDRPEVPLGRHPTRWDLDRSSLDHPIVLGRTCGHILVANSLALKRAGISRHTPDPPGGQLDRDAQGEPTGVLRETAMMRLRSAQPPPSEDRLRKALLQAGARALSMGITRIGEPGIDARLISVYTALDAEHALPLHCDLMALTLEPDGRRVAPPRLQAGNRTSLRTCKLFADGGLSSGTAALSQPYRGLTGAGTHDCGIPRFPQAQLQAEISSIVEAGLSVAVHAIGDRAISDVLDAFDSCVRHGVRHGTTQAHAGAGPGPSGPVLRIEHGGLPNREQLKRAAALGVRIATQPGFLYELGDTFRHHLPDALLGQCYPFRAMLEAGIPVGFSSDGPVIADVHPLRGLHAAYFRQSRSGAVIAASESLSVLEAITCYTAGSAAVVGMEHVLGRIAPGYRAELVVLSADPTAVAPERLLELSVVQTWQDGQCVYEG